MISASIIEAYAPLLKDYTLDFSKIGSEILYIPKFRKECLISLSKSITQKFQSEDILLNLKSPIHVVGDLHGNIRDLIRIIATNGMPNETNYLFLGDYVDRGEMSIEVLTLLFALKLQYPENVFLIRGNHEFIEVNTKYGFREQALSSYDIDIFTEFNIAFNYLPLAATIDDSIFVCHGGISPHLKSLNQIRELHRPIVSFSQSRIVEDLVWSDPVLSNTLYMPSTRGFGYLFGRDAILIFLHNIGMKTIIRAHQCVSKGYERYPNDSLFTVFSSSNYSSLPNKCGVLKVQNGVVTPTNLPQIEKLMKKDAVFKDIAITGKILPKCGRLPIIQTSTLSTIKKRKIMGINGKLPIAPNISRPIPTIASSRTARPRILSVEPRTLFSNHTIVTCPTPPLPSNSPPPC